MVSAREAASPTGMSWRIAPGRRHAFNAWLDPKEFVDDMPRYYAEDWWADQEYRPVV